MLPKYHDEYHRLVREKQKENYYLNGGQAREQIRKYMKRYKLNDDFLNDFESTLRYSQLVKAIDQSDSSIVSNETEVRALKILSAPTLQLGIPTNYTIKFDLPLSVEYYVTAATFLTSAALTVQSSSFTFNGKNCFIQDNVGILNIVTEEGSNTTIVKDIGFVDYDTGVITLSNFAPVEAFGGRIKFYVRPVSKDIFCQRNVILRVLEEDISLVVDKVRE